MWLGLNWKLTIAIADRHISRNDIYMTLYYQVSTWPMFIQTRGPLVACFLNDYALKNCLLRIWGPPGARGPGARAPMAPLLIRHCLRLSVGVSKLQVASRIPHRLSDCLFEWSTDRPFIATRTGEKGVNFVLVGRTPTHRTATTWTATVVGGCVRVRECVGVCVRACVRACVMCLPYTIIWFYPG